MFSNGLSRALRAAMHKHRLPWGPGRRKEAGPGSEAGQLRGGPGLRRLCASAASNVGGLVFSSAARGLGLRFGSGMVVGGGAVLYGTQASTSEADGANDASSSLISVPWVTEIAQSPGVQEVLVPGQMLRKHPVGKLVLEEDHLVSWLQLVVWPLLCVFVCVC